jgi:serine/threonine-protein kinase
MEHAPGGTLEQRLAAERPLPPAEARRVASDLLSGLAHVHAHGLLHRDLKPANVLFAEDGRALLADFSIARPLDADATLTGLGHDKPPLGTLSVMSPEAVRGFPLTPASDLYAAGAMLYRTLAGSHYLRFEGRTWESARAGILHEPPLPLPATADPALARVALRALDKSPERRYASAVEMLAALSPSGREGAIVRPR